MNYPTDSIETSCNIDAVCENDDRISREKELIEYFIQFRHEDLFDVTDTMYFKVDINENDILSLIFDETKDEFRNVLRDAITYAVILVNYDRNDVVNIKTQARLIRNKIIIDLNVPTNIRIGQLTASDFEGVLVTFEAKLSNWSKIRSVTHIAEYKCTECGDIISRTFSNKIKDICPRCNELYVFYKPLISEDTRRVTFREVTDDFSNGKLPFNISADIYGKIIHEVELSDRVIVTGLFRSVPLKKDDGKLSVEFIPTIQVISIKNVKKDVVLPNEDLKKKLLDLEANGKLVDAVIDGFAYNIYGKRMEKKAVLCSLIGSMWVGQVGKGNPPMIHILFVGDPDTYKSTIMKYIANVSDNMVLADSTTVSNAGIKAIAVKMDDGRWSIMAGLLPTHNGGNVFLDEFGDLKEEIYADLKAPMIDGRVTKYVAGEEFSGTAETGLLASMNPTDGVYDDTLTMYENLSVLKRPLITRFDAIFKFTKKSKDYNSALIRGHFKQCDLHGKPTEYLTDAEIKLFINYVKTIKPELTEEALNRSNEFFAGIESKSVEKNGTETRTENAIVKFAVALAKWHMSDKVLLQHVNEALDLYKSALATFGMIFENGEFITELSLKKTADGRRIAVGNAYDKIKNEDGYAFEDDIITGALVYGCFNNRHQAEALLNLLRIEGKLITKNKMSKINWK